MNPSDWLALIAVVLASTSLTWTIRMDLMRHPRLKVRLAFGTFIEGRGKRMLFSCPDRIEQDSFIVVQAVNTGERSIHILKEVAKEKAGFLKNEYVGTFLDPFNDFIPGDCLPKKLDPGTVW